MESGSTVLSVVGAISIAFGVLVASGNNHNLNTVAIGNNLTIQTEESELLATKPKCKTGTKAGKTPISLVVGAKVSCYNVASAAVGKKLLTKDFSKSCSTCHSGFGIAPSTQMNTKLRAQGYTLKPASIIAAFNAHASEMAGSVITAKDAKAISNYLQSIK